MASPQRHTLIVLVIVQVLGGVGVSTGLAISTLAAARLSGSDLIGGSALTCVVVGAALAAIPTARLANRSGRRVSLVAGYAVATIGAFVSAVALAVGSWPLLLAASLPFGAATAANLAGRFAATDLADPRRRGRALAVVVWATTIGAVAGPNLAAPAQRAAEGVGLTGASGPYLLCTLAFGLAALVGFGWLRPDPLLLARKLAADAAERAGTAAPAPGGSAWRALRAAPAAQLAIGGIVVCHLVMVGVMSMTPVYMDHAGATLQLVGLVISLHVAGMYALSPVFGVLADRVGRLPMLGLAAVLLGVAAVVAGTSDGHDAGRLSVGLIALGLGWSAGLIAGSAMIIDAVPLADRVGVQGLADVAMNASGAVGAVAAGLTVAAASFTVLGLAAAVLALPLLVAAIHRARRPWPATPAAVG